MYNPFLNLAAGFYDRLGIQTAVVNTQENADPELDFGLRKTILENTSYRFPVLPGAGEGESKILYLITDLYGCCYVQIPVPGQELPLAMLIGPYITQTLNADDIQHICRIRHIPQEHTGFLYQYFSSVPVLSSAGMHEAFLFSLGRELYGPGNFSLSYYEESPDPEAVYRERPPLEYSESTRAAVEKRYKQENIIMDCVAAGDAQGAEKAAFSGVFESLTQRSKTTLQSEKDYLLVLNTLCRKAAERAGLHPVYLDMLARKNGIRIEGLPSVAESDKIRKEIISTYCKSVQENNTRGYSDAVQKVINHISLNLSSEDLTLQAIADCFSLNKSYLSTLFKREVGMTLTDYVTKKRIEYAVYLLSTQKISIQSTAYACGINDNAYFTKLFKRETGVTPTQFRKTLSQK